MTRGWEHYVHGSSVIIPIRVCEILFRHADLNAFAFKYREQSAELDEVLKAMKYGAQLSASSDRGTEQAGGAERGAFSEWLTSRQAAIQLRMTERGVRKAITEKRLQAVLADGRWQISREALANFKRGVTPTERNTQ